MGKDNFILYSSHRELFEMLPDTQAGKLIKAIFQYEDTGEIPKLPSATLMAFASIRNSLDRNKAKYERVVERNRINGQKGGRPKTQINPDNPNGFFENPNKPKKADNDIDNKLNKTKLNNLYNYIRGKEENFENFTDKDRTSLQYLLSIYELYTEDDSSFPPSFIFELKLKFYAIAEIYKSSYKGYLRELDGNLITQKFLETANRIPIKTEEDISNFIGYLIICLRDEAVKRSEKH